MWRIHVMSYLMVRPVSINITPSHGMTLVDWRIVITLARAPDLTAQDVIQLWGLEKMAVSRAIQKLQKSGMIQRTRDATDSRRRPLRLTVKGKKAYQKLWPRAEEHYRLITSVLSERELKQFNAIADKLVARARDIIDIHYPGALSNGTLPKAESASKAS